MTRYLLIGLALLLATPAIAKDDSSDLATTAALSRVADDFYEIRYKKVLAGKKRAKTVKAYLKVSESTAWYADRQGRVDALESNSKVWIYGAPVESESVNDNGQRIVDRQVRGTLVIAMGEALNLQEGKAPEGKPRWIEATVTSKKGQALEVTYSGQSFRVLTTRNCAVLIRSKLDKRPKKLKKKLKGVVIANTSDERPEKAKKKITDNFEATHLVLVHKRLAAAYGFMR